MKTVLAVKIANAQNVTKDFIWIIKEVANNVKATALNAQVLLVAQNAK